MVGEGLARNPRFLDHPGCLETPKSPDLHEDVENLAILRGLVEEGPGKRSQKRKRVASTDR